MANGNIDKSFQPHVALMHKHTLKVDMHMK